MKTVDQTPTPVNFAAAEAAYKAASAAVDARIEYLDHHTSCTSWQKAEDRELLALVADEESAYEAMFHAASERQRRARMMVSGAFETDARPEVETCGAKPLAAKYTTYRCGGRWTVGAFALACSVLACGGDDLSDDEPSGCVCDAFGPPGIFDPSTCDDGRECCDADEDGIEDAAPTRIVCVGGGK